MDITDNEKVLRLVNQSQPTHIIHTAAITNVDFCELNEEECLKVNFEASKFLAELCAEHNIHFQFISTDFVFDGEKGNYNENDEVSPLSVYGKSKADSENYLINGTYSNWSIVRTIIVYGNGNNLSRSNLIAWAKESLEQKNEIKIIDDQFRAPTYAEDLAWACCAILEKDKCGIYNICGPETYSIYTIVERIADYFGYSMQNVERISSSTLNQPAKRPPKTGFNLSKAKADLNYQPHSLEKTLEMLYK